MSKSLICLVFLRFFTALELFYYFSIVRKLIKAKSCSFPKGALSQKGLEPLNYRESQWGMILKKLCLNILMNSVEVSGYYLGSHCYYLLLPEDIGLDLILPSWFFLVGLF